MGVDDEKGNDVDLTQSPAKLGWTRGNKVRSHAFPLDFGRAEAEPPSGAEAAAACGSGAAPPPAIVEAALASAGEAPPDDAVEQIGGLLAGQDLTQTTLKLARSRREEKRKFAASILERFQS